jgi:regulator of sigma D
MTLAGTQAGERRTGTQDMIDKLLAERQQMLVLYCRVAGLEPYRAGKTTMEALQDFCEVLVDYSAFGHFEIYQRIANGQERRERVIQVAEQVYNRIAEASEVAVAFNDKYDADHHQLDLSRLSHDMSVLGEELAVRIEMEDRIIAALTAR